MGFEVWKELSDGKIYFASGKLCEVLLVDDALYPGWLVLVPRRENATELFDLSADDQVLLIHEVNQISRAIQEAFGPDKINVGALGNVVAQLHVHVVPRFRSDKAWPGPVWGAHPCQKFTHDELCATLVKLRCAFEVSEAKSSSEPTGKAKSQNATKAE